MKLTVLSVSDRFVRTVGGFVVDVKRRVKRAVGRNGKKSVGGVLCDKMYCAKSSSGT